MLKVFKCETCRDAPHMVSENVVDYDFDTEWVRLSDLREAIHSLKRYENPPYDYVMEEKNDGIYIYCEDVLELIGEKEY